MNRNEKQGKAANMAEPLKESIYDTAMHLLRLMNTCIQEQEPDIQLKRAQTIEILMNALSKMEFKANDM